MLDTAELLRAHGHEVTLWGMDHPENGPLPHADLFVQNIDFNADGGIKAQCRAAANVIYSFEARRKISALLDRIRPDLVHLHNFAHQISPSILSAIRKRAIPMVMTMHDYKLICPSYRLLAHNRPCDECRGGRYYRCFVNRCTKDSRVKSLINVVEMTLHHPLLHLYDDIAVFISPSAFLRDKCHEMGFAGRIVHLPNFVRVQDYPVLDGGAGPRTVVYVGRLSEEKGLFTLIRAMENVDATLILVGDGPKRAELQNLACEMNLPVRFPGYLQGETLRRTMAEASVCAIPSEWYENNPRSVIEAMAMGRPVIGARIGGIPELVRDGETGWTFESGNVEDLRQKLQCAVATDAETLRAMGRAARSLVEREFSVETHYQRLLAIYADAMGSSRR
jgi:glycosyltransferase involved in cell wall biosynthesis